MSPIERSGGGGGVTSLASGKTSVTSGDLTTSSGTPVDLTGVTVTITTGARRALVTFVATAQCNTSGIGIHFDLAIDGTRQGGAAGLVTYTTPGVGFNINPDFAYLTDPLTAAAHTFKIQFWGDGVATLKVFASAIAPAIIGAVELLT